MKIVVSGGSGFIGTPLVERLVARGDDVVVLTRNRAHVKVGRGIEWHPPKSGPWTEEVRRADAVVNLAGENVGGGRWTEERKRRLVASRLDATSSLADAIVASGREIAFVSASAVGYYGNRGDEVVDESASEGSGFLAELSRKWEEAAQRAAGTPRLAILRFGVVLETSGGALAKMLLPFRLGAGGKIGSGAQWMAWVDRVDAVRAIEWAIDCKSARGIYNVTAPEPVRNRDFTRALGSALHRPAIVPMPAFALRLALGEMADETLLAGQRAVPGRLMSDGFVFHYPRIEQSFGRMFP